MADELVSHVRPAMVRPSTPSGLADWAEVFGVQSTYPDACGDEPSMVRIHSGNGAARRWTDRAIAGFDQAVTDVGRSENDPVRAVVYDHFASEHNDYV